MSRSACLGQNSNVLESGREGYDCRLPRLALLGKSLATPFRLDLHNSEIAPGLCRGWVSGGGTTRKMKTRAGSIMQGAERLHSFWS